MNQPNESRIQASRLKSEVDQLRRDLRDVQERADEALTALANGGTLGIVGMGGSVLGQAARDVEQRAVRISTILELAFEHDIMSIGQARAALVGNPIPAQ